MKVFEKTKMLTDAHMHYCPGCTHGIVHRILAESIDCEALRTMRYCVAEYLKRIEEREAEEKSDE